MQVRGLKLLHRTYYHNLHFAPHADNARFHRFKILQALAQKFECSVLPLSPYFSELNPIKKTWDNIKSHLRKILPNSKNFDDTL